MSIPEGRCGATMGSALVFRIGLPVMRRFVIVEGAVPVRHGVVGDQSVDRISRRGLELLLRIADDVASLTLVVFQRFPGNRVVFLPHPEKAAEADDGKHYVVGKLVEN